MAEIFCIFECLLTQNPTKKVLNSIDSSRSYGRLSENPKTGASMELLLPENDFKISSAVNFPENVQILETWKQTKDINLRLVSFSNALLYMNSNWIFYKFLNFVFLEKLILER